MQQLIGAVSLDVMTEASVDACADMGAPSADAAHAAWIAWRERHQIAPLRSVLAASKRRQGSEAPAWKQITEPMRRRVLGEADPERVRLFRDFDPDEPGGEVPDPFFGGDEGFGTVLAMVERTSIRRTPSG